MNKALLLSTVVISTLIMTNACTNKQQLNYPKTAKVDTVDVYFGHQVADPYRWLEDDNSAETGAWVEAQNQITNQYLNKIPFRDKIKARLAETWAYERISAPEKKGNYLFYYKHDGIKNHAILYAKDIRTDEEKILIDPNRFSDDGTTSLGGASLSENGEYIAYAISKGGSDWREVFVRDVETGKDLDDHLQWIKFSDLSWDNNGFYYSRYNQPGIGTELSGSNTFQKIYYHKLGTAQEKDVLIYQNLQKPLQTYTAKVTDKNQYLLLYTGESTQGNSVALKNLTNDGKWIMADTSMTSETSYIATVSKKLLFLTNQDAPRYRLVAIDPNNPEQHNWNEVLPESSHVLKNVTLTNNFIIAHYMVDTQSQLKVFSTAGNFLYNINLPTDNGAVTSIEPVKDENRIYYTFTSYTTPHQVLEFDLNTQSATLYFKPKVDFNPDEYETKLVFVQARDGAQIPLHIVHKKGCTMDGQQPTLLYGYGGFNIVYQPGFDVRLIPWLENGGIYVNAHIRGGGEYGDDWHNSGTKMNKQNVFDDFILAAEYLIETGYTNPDKLAMMGGSNGGLLIGAVANQRPDLFKVALPAVGVMDMLRYQYFTIGWAWAGDYGRSDDSEEMFKYLYAYSPLHNIPKSDLFPATLVTTADHDDRVVPAHSFKYTATLQENYSGPNPVLIRIETKAGHGAGKPVSMQIDEVADKWAFTLYNMGLNYVHQ